MRSSIRNSLNLALRIKEALWAQICLRRCTAVGFRTRVQGRVIVLNAGTIRLAPRVKLRASHVPIELAAGVGAELTLGENVFINSGTAICAAKSVRIGNNVSIGNYCLIYDTDFHEVDDEMRTRIPEPKPVVIEDGVWLAARVTVLKGVTIGRGAVVSTGAVVTSDVAPYTLVGGIPARFLRSIETHDRDTNQTAPARVEKAAS